MIYRKQGYIITFGNDFVHFVFDRWEEAAQHIVKSGHGEWQGAFLYFDPNFDIEQITIH